MRDDTDVMATWKEFSDQAPELAAAALARLTATKHHVLATLRADGSPRVSGTEVLVWNDTLTLGSMPGAMKARDLQRDPRFALHSNPGDGSMTAGDIKISGRAIEQGPDAVAAYLGDAPETPQPFHLFVLDIDDVVEAGLNDTRTGMLIRWWRPGVAVEEFQRA